MDLITSFPSHSPRVSQLSDLYNTKLNIICAFIIHSGAQQRPAIVLQRSVFVGEERSFEEQRQPGKAEAAHELVMVLLFLYSPEHTRTHFFSQTQSLMLNPSFSRPCQDIPCR